MHSYKQTKNMKKCIVKRFLFLPQKNKERPVKWIDPNTKQKNTELKITEPCHLMKTKPVRGQCLQKYQII